MQISLQAIYSRLLATTTQSFHRFLFDRFNLNNRLTGLIGPRGAGKTTLLLQYIKQHYPNDPHVFYFSADHLYFKAITLYAFVEELFLKQAVSIFFIDEIHKYDNWNQELKNLYDGFPTIKIVFSGSSSIDLVKGTYDLSRRAKMFYLPGLSFREYLNLFHNMKLNSYELSTLIHHPEKIAHDIANIPGLLGHFHYYLKQGFYPFLKEDPLSYFENILSVIDKTIYEDIANFYNLKTGNLKYLSKILNYLASVSPGKISTYNLSQNLKIDDKTAGHYLKILSETGLVDIIYPTESSNARLRKPEKVFLNNTNLHYAIGNHLAKPIEIGAVRELCFIQFIKNAGFDIFCDKHGDYYVDQTVYEVGGKNKTRDQIKNIKNAFLVKDDILLPSAGVIPLLYFGFLY